MDIIEKIKGFLTDPAKTFNAVKQESLGEAIKYYAIIAAVYSAILALMFAFMGAFLGSMMGFGNAGRMIGAGAGIGTAIIFFIVFLLSAIIGAFIAGAILHIFVYIVGGRKGIAQTIKALMYGSTPTLLFGWIPFIGLLAGIWSLILEIIGIKELHELTTGKAIMAVLIPIILLIILAIIIAVLFAALFALSTRSYY
jgi:hypothetical protein